ncbi:uncharacterized protein LOC108680020 [Hyalella azteca]|uniref:Uncharacterized protein LOC108680020 n=1 Tax=Hyalella azteca TaxID=294128 RepID=A0A8B7PE30_HYAAZ|nr:uncharacterized protein LOC108680020 [Hyalella azteca]
MDTSVLCPHSARIRGCALQPQLCSTASSDLPLCLTFCEAGDIKLWGARLNDGVSQWACVSSGGCWDGSSVAQCGVWSWCGTLIAVAHQRLVSVWRPDPLKRCFALSHEQLQEPLTDMCFSWLPGGGACVVECRPSAVSSWCLRSRQLLYMAPLAALAVAYDPNTALLAVATHDNQVILYRGGELVPLRLYDIGSSAAFRLLFLPAASTPLLSSYTRLFFFTFSLELMSFPIYTCDKDLASSELLCPHPQEQEERPTLGLSLLLAEKTSVDAPAQNLFSFRVADGSAALRQTCIVEDFEDSCDVMSQLSKLVLDFGKKTELTATGAAR